MTRCTGHVSFYSDYHPYECSHDDGCIHCAGTKTVQHDPQNCCLCRWDDEEFLEKVWADECCMDEKGEMDGE